ncbi:MAG: hypothetical protein LBV30_09365 [Propionibacteriaceae bacterium]|jgi:flotillin|nr:hypothetical protein [Propionibacteriaceae bacterium]
MNGQSSTILGIVLAVVAVIIIVFLIAKRYKIPDANQALIITGAKGKGSPGEVALKVVMGSGAFIVPFVQRGRMLSLDATEIAMQVPEGVSKDNIKVVVDAVALAKIDGTPTGVRSAAQRFLGREEEIPRIIQSILAGALRGVVGNMTIEEMLRDREGLATKIQDAASTALSDAGLRVDTLQINGISTDPVDYITNLGRPQAAQVRKSAEVAEAQNEQEAERAKAEARIQIAAARKDAQLKEAGFLKETAQAEAEAQAVGPMTKAAQEAKITQAEQQNAQQVATLTKLQLDSDVRARADANLYAQQKAADAELYTAEQRAKAQAVQVTAAAEAEQTKLTREGEGQASAIRAAGLAEAEAIKAKGQAEAQVKELLAAAYQKYGQQAVIDRVLTSMPDMLQAVAKPLGDIDHLTVIGDANSAQGITKLSTDLLVKLPAVIQSATGLDLTGLLNQWFASGSIVEPAVVGQGSETESSASAPATAQPTVSSAASLETPSK